MRRFFVLFSFLLVCAVGFADQPWEDVSVFAPSFKSCLIQANESNLAFQAVLGDESFYFKVGKDDEKAFLDLINSDHSLSDKKRVIDNYIMTAVTVHRDGCTVTKLANGNSSNPTYHVTLEDRHRRDAAAEKERQDEASASRVARSNPAARDWDIPGMGDGVSRQMASSSRHKENPATRDWQLPSERSGEPDRTGIFAAADRAEERRDYAAKKDNSVCVSAVPEHEYGDNTAYSSNDSSSADIKAEQDGDEFSGWWVIGLIVLFAVFSKAGTSGGKEEQKVRREYDKALREARRKDRENERAEAAEEARKKRQRWQRIEDIDRRAREERKWRQDYM